MEENLQDIQDVENADSPDEEIKQPQEDAPADTPDSSDAIEVDDVRDADADQAQPAASEETENEPFITVQYNHKNKDLSREEAVEIIQKGLHTEKLKEKLECAAALQGKSVNRLVDDIITAPERELRVRLTEIYGEGSPDIEIGLGVFREKQSEQYKNIMREREDEKSMNEKVQEQSIFSRLADQYIELKKEVSDAPEYDKLPDEVIIEAASGKRDLYSSYLCYLNRERIKKEAALKSQQAADNASAGRMGGQSGENISTRERSFLDGLWGK